MSGKKGKSRSTDYFEGRDDHEESEDEERKEFQTAKEDLAGRVDQDERNE